MSRFLAALVAVITMGLAVVYAVGTGVGTEAQTGGKPEARAAAEAVVARRGKLVRDAAVALGVEHPKQILFGDLHVHSTFSFDAFRLSLPLVGGDGAHPIADACDFARHCSELDFWSINDHAMSIGPRRWAETVDTIRQCNALSENPHNPDTVAFLGWEWTQVGATPETHYGHKNVILRDLEDGQIPTRPISAAVARGTSTAEDAATSNFVLGLLSLTQWNTGGPAYTRYLKETFELHDCPDGVPVRELPTDCREVAATPEALFEKLDDWGLNSIVIPHGTAWGFYTPQGSAWDKQLADGMHDPNRQRLIEIMSGHGNSEQYRSYREVIIAEDGSRSCPEPGDDYLPSCWRAGEIIEVRCLSENESTEECASRAALARQHYLAAERNGGVLTIPGTEIADWQDAGQCRDCFQPPFNHRPRSSVQYITALENPKAKRPDADRFRFGFIGSSDNHSARPGTGYKELARSEFTEARFVQFPTSPGELQKKPPVAHSEAMDAGLTSSVIYSIYETERASSFFLNGGLAAVHSQGRSREEIWQALERKEVYGTSGPRILLWFDLLNGPGGQSIPMGGEVRLDEPPVFRVRAVGSFEQKPGCPADSTSAMSPGRLARLCQGECYHPSDRRRPITRLEVVRILPQERRSESVEPLIQDPWRVIDCAGAADGCTAEFTDEDFVTLAHDAVYYVRAIEAPSLAVAADPLGCTQDDGGRCAELDSCAARATDDDCLAPTEERAWSSPIFVDAKL